MYKRRHFLSRHGESSSIVPCPLRHLLSSSMNVLFVFPLHLLCGSSILSIILQICLLALVCTRLKPSQSGFFNFVSKTSGQRCPSDVLRPIPVHLRHSQRISTISLISLPSCTPFCQTFPSSLLSKITFGLSPLTRPCLQSLLHLFTILP